MQAFVYKSLKKADTYVYLAARDAFERLPEPLRTQLGGLQFVLEVGLTPERRLAREDVAVVKVDINRPEHKGIDWKSPVAQQYALQSVPNFKVYGPDGKLVAEGKDAAKMVYGMLE